MDWYFGHGIEDLVVPRDQELCDRLPSPESWSQWGLTAPGNFESSNKCFFMDENLSRGELRFNGKLCHDAEFESSANAKDSSSCLSRCGGLSEESLNQAPVSHPPPDYQLDDFARFQQIDDIFLITARGHPMEIEGFRRSSLEGLSGIEDIHKSFCFSPEYRCDKMPADCLMTDASSDSQSISNNEHGMGSGKYLKTHAFSPSVNLEKEIPASRNIPCKTELKNNSIVKAPLAKILVPPEQSCANGFVSGEISLEESVLQELEMVMAQLSDRTRLCFRDAFYRLAKNSEQSPVVPNQFENLHEQTHPPMWTISEEKTRSKRKETVTESETNTIDRAIANLTFNKMETNVRDFHVANDNKQNVVKAMGQPNQSSNQSQMHYFAQPSVAPNDAQVPFLVHNRS